MTHRPGARIRILSPDGPTLTPGFHAGGVRKLHDHARILTDHGYDAQVVGDADAASDADLIVLPEVYGDDLRTMHPGIPKVSLNQNVHYTWEKVADPTRHPYNDNPDLVAVLAVSAHTEFVLRAVFPDVAVYRFVTSVGRPEDFWCGPYPRHRAICYFARKKPDRSRLVFAALATAGDLDGWQLIAMDGMTDSEVGDTMRSAAIFASFSDLEGFGSPPLEAIACGCQVAGFAAGGGREFLRVPWATPVADDDFYAMFLALRILIAGWPHDAGQGRVASAWALGTYSQGREAATLTRLFDTFTDRQAVA